MIWKRFDRTHNYSINSTAIILIIVQNQYVNVSEDSVKRNTFGNVQECSQQFIDGRTLLKKT